MGPSGEGGMAEGIYAGTEGVVIAEELGQGEVPR
jgi:hypothetical protein